MRSRALSLSLLVVPALAGLAACQGEPPSGPVVGEVRFGKGNGNGGGGNGSGGGGAEPTVDDTDPGSAPQDTTLSVGVIGTNFDEGSTVEFLLNGAKTNKVTTNFTRFVRADSLVANITIAADAVPDQYDVQVTTSRKKKGIGIELFEITLSKFGQLALEITFRDALGDGLQSDGMKGLAYCDPGVPCYEEGQETDARFSGNGNLMFWLYEDSSRRVNVLGELLLTRRIYTNDNQDGQGVTVPSLITMADGTITSRMIVERGDGNGHYRYGVNCTGDSFERDDDNAIREERISVTRSGFTWTLEGWDARHCQTSGKGKHATTTETAIWMPFRMTLVAIPWPE